MKLLLLLLLFPFALSAQLTYYIRSDSVNLLKNGGNNELIIQNATRNVPGVLVNKGNGRTEFSRARFSGDTLFIGRDTILGNGASSSGWSLSGNTGAGHFLGSTDAQPLAFRTNNTERFRVQATGNVGINTTTPAYTLDVAGSLGVTTVPFSGVTNDTCMYWNESTRQVERRLCPTGGGGGGSDTTLLTEVVPRSYLSGPLSAATVTEQTNAVQAAILDAEAKNIGVFLDTIYWVNPNVITTTTLRSLRGNGNRSGLYTDSQTGVVLTVNNTATNNYYNVVFQGYNGVVLRDFKLQYMGPGTSRDASQRGLLFTATGGQTQRHLVQNLTIQNFLVGMEGHNLHATDISYNYFRNNPLHDFLFTGTASNDYGDTHFNHNYMSLHDTVGGFTQDSSASVRIDYGSAIVISDNKFWGYHDFGVHFKGANTSEDFEAVGRTETFINDNTFSYQQKEAIFFESYFGVTGSGAGTFNGNRFADISIRNNNVNNSGGFFKFKGGANAFSNINIIGNELATVTVPQPSVITLGSSIKNLTLKSNNFNNAHFGTDFNFGGTPIDITSGSLSGTVQSYANTYKGWDNPSDIPETMTLDYVVQNGNTTTRDIQIGTGISNLPTYVNFVVSERPANPNVGAIAVTDGGNSGQYGMMRYNGANVVFSGYDFLAGAPLPVHIGETGGNVTVNGTTTVAGSLTVTDLTAGRIPYVTTADLIVDQADFRFDGTNMTVGASSQFGKLGIETNTQLDGIRLRGNDYPTYQIRNGADIYMYLTGITANTGLVSNSLTNDVVLKTGVAGGRVLINGTGTGTSSMTVSAAGVGIKTTGDPATVLHSVGTVRHASLGTATDDTTTYKPLAIDATGNLIPFTIWPASGGGGGGSYTFTAADFNESGSTVSIDYANAQAASGSTKGFLTSADWTTFNNKVSSQWTTSGANIHRATGQVTVGGTTPNASNVFTVETDGSSLSAIAIVDNAASGHSFWFHPRAGGTAGNFGFYDQTASSYRFFFNGGNLGLGNVTNASEVLQVAGNIRFSGALMPNNTAGSSGQHLVSAGAGAPPTWETPLTLADNEYTPTLTAVTNVSASSAAVTNYFRIGNRVEVFGTFTVTPTGELSDTQIDMSLPIPSDIGASTEGGGSGALLVSLVSGNGVVIDMDATNDRARFRFHAPSDGTPITVSFKFGYKITPP